MKNHITNSLEETESLAKLWLQNLSAKYSDKNDSLVVMLSGHIGAGKTTFIKSVAKILGVEEVVTSPTFVIMKMYGLGEPSASGQDDNLNIPWKRLVHIDAYRLEKPEEFEIVGLEQLVADKNNLIMIEWPENVAEALEGINPIEKINFTVAGEKARGVEF